MILKGTVRNVIDFGAFVDIGVHQDGLVHISQLTNKRYIRHALDFVSVGDVVDVKVLSVDPGRGRIQLSMSFEEAGVLARDAGVKELWLTHYSPALNHPENYLDDVKKIFDNTHTCKDRRSAELNFDED